MIRHFYLTLKEALAVSTLLGKTEALSSWREWYWALKTVFNAGLARLRRVECWSNLCDNIFSIKKKDDGKKKKKRIVFFNFEVQNLFFLPFSLGIFPRLLCLHSWARHTKSSDRLFYPTIANTLSSSQIYIHLRISYRTNIWSLCIWNESLLQPDYHCHYSTIDLKRVNRDPGPFVQTSEKQKMQKYIKCGS